MPIKFSDAFVEAMLQKISGDDGDKVVFNVDIDTPKGIQPGDIIRVTVVIRADEAGALHIIHNWRKV